MKKQVSLAICVILTLFVIVFYVLKGQRREGAGVVVERITTTRTYLAIQVDKEYIVLQVPLKTFVTLKVGDKVKFSYYYSSFVDETHSAIITLVE